MKLSKCIALIVGGGSGLGRAAAVALAQQGATIVAADLNLLAARETIGRAVTGSGLALALDIADPAAISGAVAQVIEKFGRLEIVVNCAAICLVDAGRCPCDDS